MSKDSTNLLNWFGKRKEDVVSSGLRIMSLSVLDTVTELGLAMHAMCDSDIASAKKAMERLHKCEHEADSKEDELCNQISIGELSPQEREDLMHFIRKTDKIADWAKEASIYMRLMDEVGIEVPKQIWIMLSQTVRDLESEVRYLTNAMNMLGTESSGVTVCVEGIREMEKTIDRAYFDLNKEIFMSDLDAKATILLTRILDAVEMAADTCKSCSDTVAVIYYAKKVRR